MLTRWKVLLDEVERNERIAEAAQELVRTMDRVLGEEWRASTLGAGDHGDEVNRSWDELVATIEGGEK